jgi:hypothetical protein
METIQDVEILKSKDLKIGKRKTKKTQILLYDTQRRFNDFIQKISNRLNGEYTDIPHFVVTKSGHIFQLFDTNYTSTTFKVSKLDNKFIKIAIENLGWLNKNTINGFLFNWIGDPYRSEPFIKGWRNRYYWDKYPTEQVKSVVELCHFLCEKHNIPNQIVPSQGYIENVYNFPGIVCKSNFSDIYTDINPSFNFRLFYNDEKEKYNELRSDEENAEHIEET